MKEEKRYYVYITASRKNGTLYIGVTNSLIKRIAEHKEKSKKHFTNKYKVGKLVYYEIFRDIHLAISREKQLKNWHRDWKINLIEKDNPGWRDLYNDHFSGS